MPRQTRIPPETFAYRLGNRSALEWVIDQYQVNTDKRSGITNEPNTKSTPHPRPQEGEASFVPRHPN
jgi:predicted helicase